MNDLEVLAREISRTHPDAQLRLTAPSEKDGVWWLDVSLREIQIVIEWNADSGFGITSSPSDSYGERPDESYTTLDKVSQRLQALLIGSGQTSPPLPIWLARLREDKGVTQQELANRLGVRQASVSGFERRQDIQVSTLRRIVCALGGHLQICALFPDGKYTFESGQIHLASSREDVNTSFKGTEQIADLLRATSTWKLDSRGCLEQAVHWGGRVKQSHMLLEIP
jgi:transcriptional regulator with XRE-family HTH domain